MKKNFWLIILAVLIAGGVLGFFYFRDTKIKNSPAAENTVPETSKKTAVKKQNLLAFPIADFKKRITKKFFGTFVTPQNSPVRPERFRGFHTGDDVEYQDVKSNVPVYAVAAGKVTYSNWVSGYGGVFIIRVKTNGRYHSVLYGHIRPSTLPRLGSSVSKGEKLALLGTSFSHETDGERRHLHFAILSNDRIDLKGYVQNRSELSGWINPLSFYK